MDNTEYIRRYTDRFVDRRKAQQANEVIDYLYHAPDGHNQGRGKWLDKMVAPDQEDDPEYPADCVCSHGYDEHDIGNGSDLEPCMHLMTFGSRCVCMTWAPPPLESPISKP
jgi:hypothetical protein